MKFSYFDRFIFSRPIPLTTPRVTVRSKPNGLPTAKTHWPTRTIPRIPELRIRKRRDPW